jgi:hypothetical protein
MKYIKTCFPPEKPLEIRELVLIWRACGATAPAKHRAPELTGHVFCPTVEKRVRTFC